MIYTMPRMTTHLNLQADRPGVYDGLSSHFSGDGFPGMQFKVQALPPDQFAMWAQGARGQGPALDGRGYTELLKPSSYVKPMTYGGRRARPVRRHRREPCADSVRCPLHNITSRSRDRRHDDVREADLARYPVRSADPADHVARGDSSRSRGSAIWVWRNGWWPYLWHEYITSTDHKHIGVMYIVLALLMLVRGFADAIMMRIAAVARDRPIAGFSAARALQPDLLGARHDHDLLRGDAVRHRVHELRRSACSSACATSPSRR